jgi:hypothetical protein
MTTRLIALLLPEIGVHIVDRRIKRDDQGPFQRRRLEESSCAGLDERASELAVAIRRGQVSVGPSLHP